jgi:hypothetical protein
LILRIQNSRAARSPRLNDPVKAVQLVPKVPVVPTLQTSALVNTPDELICFLQALKSPVVFPTDNSSGVAHARRDLAGRKSILWTGWTVRVTIKLTASITAK